MKSILSISLMNNGREEGLSAAFRKKTSEYYELKVSPVLKQQLNNIEVFPDIIFIQIQNGTIGDAPSHIVLGDYLQKAKKAGSFIINWTGDMRQNIPHWMNSFAHLVNITCFSNERDARNFPYPSAFLQIGFDPEVFKEWEDSSAPWHDVVFMGNDYGNQFPLGGFRRNIVDVLITYYKRSAVYGNYKKAVKALNPDPNNPIPIQSQESKIYNNCKIAISASHFTVPRYTSDRLFRCLGSGAMVLAHEYPEIGKDFEIGKHLDVFKNVDEMRAKIDFYLANPKKRIRIAEEGFKYAHSNFTYENMVDNIIKLSDENS